ncbi:MAG: DnaA regulatory inactivator Hda [Methylophilales bacterium]|nr:DnaA regulatory inactivator Hda [Methylophilales bacterium]
MKQLLLDIKPVPAPTLQNFVVGSNGELLQTLLNLIEGTQGQHSLTLWGEAGSGKSHLLHAVTSFVAEHGISAIYLDAPQAETINLLEHSLVALDNAQNLDETSQIALFNLFNRYREQGKTLIVAVPVAPAQLALRDDIKTRLAWGLVYQVLSLSDTEKAQALKRHARERGMNLPDDVVEYFLRHMKRDLPTLMTILDALDDWSLTAKKPVTVAMARQLVQVAN